MTFKPNDEHRRQVDAMAAYGVPEESIAKVLGISPHTLRKYFRDELDTAHVKANSAVAQSLYRKATGDGAGSVVAAIFWLKTRAGWREAQSSEFGKKEQLNEDAKTAGRNSDWGSDLEYTPGPAH